MGRLILFSGLPSTQGCGAVSLQPEQENLSVEELATAITQASNEHRLCGVLRTEDKRTTWELTNCLTGLRATHNCDLDFDIQTLAAGDEVIACPAPFEERLRWSRFRVMPIVGDYDAFDVGHTGTPGDTESPD